MVETAAQENNPPTGTRDEPIAQLESTLRDKLNVMHESDIPLRPEQETNSTSFQFWTGYELEANQHDDELLDRLNKYMDGLGWVAGILSAVNSTFIVRIESSQTPDPSDTTNALLMILINRVDNVTFSDVPLPNWTGPSSTDIWIRSLMYVGLSLSLLTVLGAVLGKQWLWAFRRPPLMGESLAERCKRRQLKLDGLRTWGFNNMIGAFSVLLQASLFFFGVALSANLYNQQKTVGAVFLGTLAGGLGVYMNILVNTLMSPFSPFETPTSLLLALIYRTSTQSNFWNGFATGLIYAWDFMAGGWGVQLQPNDRESAIDIEMRAPPSRDLDLGFLDSRVKPSGGRLVQRILNSSRARSVQWIFMPSLRLVQWISMPGFPSGGVRSVQRILDSGGSRSVQWILQRSTDMEMITAAMQMVPEVEWLDRHIAIGVLDRLKGQFYGCFDSSQQLLPLAHARAVACIKAISHLWFEGYAKKPLLRVIQGGVYSDEHNHTYYLPEDRDFLAVLHALGSSLNLDITSLSFSDRMWMAHMFTNGLCREYYYPDFNTSVTDFINTCLNDSRSPPRLVADCLLSVGMLLGMQTNQRYLAKLDKSVAIPYLRDSVFKRLLAILLNEVPVEPSHTLVAKSLLHTLCSYRGKTSNHDTNQTMSIQCLQCTFRILEDERGVSEDDVRFNNVTAMLHLCLLHSSLKETDRVWHFLHQKGSSVESWYWLEPPDWHTPQQFDLLVDYLLWLCDRTDYVAIGDAFAVLAGLRGSPSTLIRKRTYIETVICFMGSEKPLHTRHAALNAACMVRTDIASMGKYDASLRYRFSQAITSAVLGDTEQQLISQGDNDPFTNISFFDWNRESHYLRSLCTLAKEPTWHGQLQRSNHFNICLTIARTLSSPGLIFEPAHGELAVHITHIFAIVDSLGDPELQFLEAVQSYPSWPLILTAWRFIFQFSFFKEATDQNWKYVADNGYPEALASVMAYVRKYRERWDNSDLTRTLIHLVGQVCDKLEESYRRTLDITPLEHGQSMSFGHQGVPTLGKQINTLLRVLR